MVTFVNSIHTFSCENIVSVGMPGCSRTGEVLRRAEKALYGRRKQLAKLCKVHMLKLGQYRTEK